jgi:hypothetical protein
MDKASQHAADEARTEKRDILPETARSRLAAYRLAVDKGMERNFNAKTQRVKRKDTKNCLLFLSISLRPFGRLVPALPD